MQRRKFSYEPRFTNEKTDTGRVNFPELTQQELAAEWAQNLCFSVTAFYLA